MNDLPREEIYQLLNLIAHGNDKAFKKIYFHYQPNLSKFIRYQVNDDSSVEEIMNDTFMVLCKKPHGYDGSCKFFTWLCAIASYKAKDWGRKQNRQPPTQEIDEAIINTIPDDSKSILEILEHQEIDEVLRECVKQLPPKQREAISLVFFNDEKLEAIALMQDCPIGTVKTRLMHARLKITECVKKALGNGKLS
ncbi:MAG: RNA polymerase sigma factor [Methylophilus sp.]|uniref:RNA polymerase sigma factor n=1 Tax=Methylophilus sp. TaxID=29541 RepID=UPI003FA0DD5D